MPDLVKRLNVEDSGFLQELDALIFSQGEEDDGIRKTVGEIITGVRQRGDSALLEYAKKFDAVDAANVSDLEISQEQMKSACERVDSIVMEAIKTSISRVRNYHEKQKAASLSSWQYEDASGNSLGQIVRGVERAGIYVPGGKASYPSSVIMTAIPAKVAEVAEVIMMVPAEKPLEKSKQPGELGDLLLATAYLCGVDRLFTFGGAHAIAALAYGTETVPRVDKIAGPGNIYVATAKTMVFGDVGIDMVAGPSEVVIIADQTANVEWLVMDLFAQAEHDEMARAILISTDISLIEAVSQEILVRLDQMERSEIIRKSLVSRGLLILAPDMARAVEVSNHIAPEHLELAVEFPEKILPDVKHAGAIFVGHHSAEVVGDYTAGPSHVLPTGGSARFASPLGVYDFQVRSSLIHCSPKGAVELSRDAAIIAREEGLEAHALSAELRLRG